MQTDKPKVFISYARVDAEFALRLAKDLRSAGINIWLDQLDITPGDRWDRAVEAALRDCPCFLIILSPASVASHNVMDEVSFGLEQNKRILPVRYQDCEVPFRMRRLQRIDFTGDYSNSFSQLRTALEAVESSRILQSTDFKEDDRDPTRKTTESATTGTRSSNISSDFEGQEEMAPLKAKEDPHRPSGGISYKSSTYSYRKPGWIAISVGLILVLSIVVLTVTKSSWLTKEQNRGPGEEGHSLLFVPPDTVRLKGDKTLRGHGFFTPRGYVIADRIPFEREQQLVAESPNDPGKAPFKLQLMRVAKSIPVALSRPVDVPLIVHPMNVRPAGSLTIGEVVELYRGPNYTTPGKVLRKNVKTDLTGAHGKETQEHLLETSNISSSGDSGAPVVDSQKRVVGMLYGGSDEVSLAVPVELIMAAFPEAF